MIANIIERILRDFPQTRASDKQLLLKVWEAQGLYFSETQRDKFLQVGSSETIRRVRQKLQEQGKYKAPEAVARERRVRSYIVQQNAPVAKPERIVTILNQSNLL